MGTREMGNDAIYVLNLGTDGIPWTRTGVCGYGKLPVAFGDGRLAFLVRTEDADEVFALFRKVHDMRIAHETETEADAGMDAADAASGVVLCCKPNDLGWRLGKDYAVMIDRVPVSGRS